MARILLPTDFSTNALNAATYAVKLFGTEGNSFVLLTTYMMPHGTASTMWNINGLLAQEAAQGLEAFAARLRSELGDAAIVLETAVEHGDLPHVVARFAADAAPADLVVMGTQGASGLREVLMGTNTAAVIAGGSLPVLAVPENAEYRTPKRILLADDGGPVGKESLQPLLAIARWSHAHVSIVRVVQEDAPVSTGSDSTYDLLMGGIPHSEQYHSGEDAQAAISELADRTEADLVAVLHRQRGLFEGLFHRSTSKRMVMHTHIPMLVLQQRAL
jgi:nucleotide-binding universal stress UspA family protein